MKLEKGDILQVGTYKILVVGYPNNLTRSIRAKILEDYFDLTDWNTTKIYTNYIDNIKKSDIIEKFIYKNVCYFYLEPKECGVNQLSIDLAFLLTKDIYKVGKYSKEEVNRFLLKKQLIYNYKYDLRDLSDTCREIEEYGYQYIKERYDDIKVKEVLLKAREEYKKYLENPKKVSLDYLRETEFLYIQWPTSVVTYSKRYMYLYELEPNSGNGLTVYYKGRALLSNKDECYKLFLKSKMHRYEEKKNSLKDMKGELAVCLNITL